MAGMSPEAFKTPYLNKAIEAHRQWVKEDNEVISAIPQLRRRFGSLLRKHIPFPEEIKGKKIKLVFSELDKDWIATPSFWSKLNQRRLGPTGLTCEAGLEEEIEVVVTSSAYPFERRPVDFTVNVAELDCSFKFDDVVSAKFEKENGEYGNVDLNQVNMLKEILTLIEDSAKTKYKPLPYYLT
jgi:hypothetical protein